MDLAEILNEIGMFENLLIVHNVLNKFLSDFHPEIRNFKEAD
jgi:hypothetical protein